LHHKNDRTSNPVIPHGYAASFAAPQSSLNSSPSFVCTKSTTGSSPFNSAVHHASLVRTLFYGLFAAEELAFHPVIEVRPKQCFF
jgi:hypothetical protein